MDIVILLIIVILIAVIFKKASNTIIFLGLIDIFLRILNFIGNNTTKEINAIINKYFPSSIPGIIEKYSSGVIETILVWGYVFLMCMFLYYVFRMLLRRI